MWLILILLRVSSIIGSSYVCSSDTIPRVDYYRDQPLEYQWVYQSSNGCSSSCWPCKQTEQYPLLRIGFHAICKEPPIQSISVVGPKRIPFFSSIPPHIGTFISTSPFITSTLCIYPFSRFYSTVSNLPNHPIPTIQPITIYQNTIHQNTITININPNPTPVNPNPTPVNPNPTPVNPTTTPVNLTTNPEPVNLTINHTTNPTTNPPQVNPTSIPTTIPFNSFQVNQVNLNPMNQVINNRLIQESKTPSNPSPKNIKLVDQTVVSLVVNPINETYQVVNQTSVSTESIHYTFYGFVFFLLLVIMILLCLLFYKKKSYPVPKLPSDLEKVWENESIPIIACITPVEKIKYTYDLTLCYEDVKDHMAVSWTFLYCLYQELDRKRNSILRRNSLKKEEPIKEYTPPSLYIYQLFPLFENEITPFIKDIFPGPYLFTRMIRSREDPSILSFVLTQDTWFFPQSYRFVVSHDVDHMFQVKSNAPELRIMNHIEISTYQDYPDRHAFYDKLIQNAYLISEYNDLQMNDVEKHNWFQLCRVRMILDRYKEAIQLKENVEWMEHALENPNYKIV
jgi:hypothetical protein